MLYTHIYIYTHIDIYIYMYTAQVVVFCGYLIWRQMFVFVLPFLLANVLCYLA